MWTLNLKPTQRDFYWTAITDFQSAKFIQKNEANFIFVSIKKMQNASENFHSNLSLFVKKKKWSEQMNFSCSIIFDISIFLDSETNPCDEPTLAMV